MAEIPVDGPMFFCEQEETLDAALTDFRRRLPEFAQVLVEFAVLASDDSCYFRFRDVSAGRAFRAFLAGGGCPDIQELRCPVTKAFIVSSVFSALAQ